MWIGLKLRYRRVSKQCSHSLNGGKMFLLVNKISQSITLSSVASWFEFFITHLSFLKYSSTHVICVIDIKERWITVVILKDQFPLDTRNRFWKSPNKNFTKRNKNGYIKRVERVSLSFTYYVSETILNKRSFHLLYNCLTLLTIWFFSERWNTILQSELFHL